MELTIPDSPTRSRSWTDRRMFAPTAERNVESICSILEVISSSWGNALELASGTGEHVVKFAEKMPSFQWQPSDIDDDRLSSIRAWTKYTKTGNVTDPIYFDVTEPLECNRFEEAFSLVVCVNLLHLISDQAVEVAIRNMAQLTAAYGGIMIYGPFKRGDSYASQKDREFDRVLRDQDPRIGLKDIELVRRSLVQSTNRTAELIKMPANNLALIIRAR